MADQRYLVAARKYRPQLFHELVAQEHVTETLQNAIRLDRLAHAYLFSGPRGVGKTTAARILAKAINCTTPLDEREGAEPCRRCDSCRSFEEGRSLNIIEIDAASNNSVDDVRSLREKVLVPPQGARKKVYIIDEVHMLSNAAFNALLKTLEEPPPHVLFIFATTEPHKVLPTILSRCQRFDFRRIAVPDIVARLREICAEEGITADDGALLLIARKGDGALRDALSVFDQAVSLCGDALTYDALAEALGVVRNDLFFDLTDRVHAADRAGVLTLVDTLVQRGYDFQEFLAGLAEHLRNLLVARTMPTADLIEADAATRQRYQDAAARTTEADLLRMLMVVDETADAVKNAPQPRLKLEMALLKLTHLARSADLAALVRKLEGLEAQIRSGKLPATPPAEPAPATPAPKPAPAPAAASGPPEPAEPEPGAQPEPTAAESEPEAPAAIDSAAEESEPTAEEPEPAPEAKPEPRPEPGDAPAGTPAIALSLFGRPALRSTDTGARPDTGRTGGSALFAGSGALAPVAGAHVDPHFGISLQTFVDLWPRFVRAVSEDRIHVGAMLQHGEPTAVARGVLQISVPDEFHRRLLTNQKDFLSGHLNDLLGESDVPAFTFVIDQQLTDEKTLEDTGLDPFEMLKSLRQENPVIRAIFDKFGGEPVW